MTALKLRLCQRAADEIAAGGEDLRRACSKNTRTFGNILWEFLKTCRRRTSAPIATTSVCGMMLVSKSFTQMASLSCVQVPQRSRQAPAVGAAQQQQHATHSACTSSRRNADSQACFRLGLARLVVDRASARRPCCEPVSETSLKLTPSSPKRSSPTTSTRQLFWRCRRETLLSRQARTRVDALHWDPERHGGAP